MESPQTDLADANLVDSFRRHANWQRPCESTEADGLFMMAGSNAKPFAYRNCAIRVDSRLPAPVALERARAYFEERDRRFTFVLRDSRDADLIPVLEAAGLKERSVSPCMLIDAPGDEPSVVGDVQVRGFDDPGTVADAVAVNAAAFQSVGLSSEEMRFYFNNPRGLLTDEVVGFVAYLGGKPVATAMTLLSGEGAGLYWVGTLAEVRGRGLGARCTWLATCAGFDHAAGVVTLQASAFGEPIYRKLGYRTYDWMRWYA